MPRTLKGKVCWWVFIDDKGEVECSEISITSTISSTTSNLCVPIAEKRVFLVRLRLMYEKTVPPDIAQQAKQGVLEADRPCGCFCCSYRSTHTFEKMARRSR
jgi:hypothetical protein